LAESRPKRRAGMMFTPENVRMTGVAVRLEE
jgi:hypothetical protein